MKKLVPNLGLTMDLLRKQLNFEQFLFYIQKNVNIPKTENCPLLLFYSIFYTDYNNYFFFFKSDCFFSIYVKLY